MSPAWQHAWQAWHSGSMPINVIVFAAQCERRLRPTGVQLNCSNASPITGQAPKSTLSGLVLQGLNGHTFPLILPVDVGEIPSETGLGLPHLEPDKLAGLKPFVN